MNKLKCMHVVALMVASTSSYAIDLNPLKAALSKAEACQVVVDHPLSSQLARAHPNLKGAYANGVGADKVSPADREVYAHSAKLQDACKDAIISYTKASEAIPMDKPLTEEEMAFINVNHEKMIVLMNKVNGIHSPGVKAK
jgi:hypothetical protein